MRTGSGQVSNYIMKSGQLLISGLVRVLSSTMLPSSLLLLATAALSQTVAAWQVELPYHVTSVPVENYTNSSGKILNKPLLAYFSIPYAQAPLGKLRFEYPVAPKPGKKVTLNNTDYGLVCSQPIPNPPVPQGEDCLTLSVFRPQNASYDKKLPVVVWTPGEYPCLCHLHVCLSSGLHEPEAEVLIRGVDEP